MTNSSGTGIYAKRVCKGQGHPKLCSKMKNHSRQGGSQHKTWQKVKCFSSKLLNFTIPFQQCYPNSKAWGGLDLSKLCESWMTNSSGTGMYAKRVCKGQDRPKLCSKMKNHSRQGGSQHKPKQKVKYFKQ